MRGLACSALVVALVAFAVVALTAPKEFTLPKDSLMWTETWGSHEESENILPFTFTSQDDDHADLKARLELTRLPKLARFQQTPWAYGTDTDYIDELVTYWKDSFDWKSAEASLASLPQFHTNVSGLDVHFVSVKADRTKYPSARPLLLLHGWPSSYFNFYKIIPMLTDPLSYGGSHEDAFDVVAPSLPGYIHSSAPEREGLGAVQMAVVMVKLMRRVAPGRQFYVHGGDWGGVIATMIGQVAPDEVLGAHLSFFPSFPPVHTLLPLWLFGDEDDRAKVFPLSRTLRMTLEESGYGHEQGTKPDTLAVGLSDSPAGMAAWIVEKYHAWSDCDGKVEARFTKDELLTQVMLYWLTNSMGSAVRLYKECANSPEFHASMAAAVPVPVGLAEFSQGLLPILNPPKSTLGNRFPRIVAHSKIPAGGHFAEMEEPALLAADIRAFAALVDQTS